MLELKEVKESELQTLKSQDTLLILDKKGSVKGMETILSYDNKTTSYSYKKYQNKKIMDFQGNLNKFISVNKWKVFKVNKNVFKYTDQELKSSWLDLENVFENIYGELIASSLTQYINNEVNKNFKSRVKFIDFCQKNKEDIHVVRWQIDKELGYTKEMVKNSTNHLKSLLENFKLEE